MMKKLIAVLSIGAMLVACGGQTDPDGGSGNPNNPPQTSKGDEALGLQEYQARCTNCHDVDGTSKLNKNQSPIVSAKTTYTGGRSLEDYIAQEMPPSGTKCEGDCAKNIAAYIQAQGWVADVGGAKLEPIVYASAPGTNIDVPSTACNELPATPGTMLIRDQFKNVISDVFSPIVFDNLDELVAQIPDLEKNAQMDDILLFRLLAVGEELGAQVADNFASLNLQCNGGNNSRNCAGAFIEKHGSLALSKIIDEQDKNDMLLNLFDDESDFKSGIKQLVKAMLVSSDFLYRIETGLEANNGSVVLTTGEKASKLSWLLWNSVPDMALLEAAAQGGLNTKAGFHAEVDRMIADPKFNRSLSFFKDFWIYLDPKDTGDRDLLADSVHELGLILQSAFAKGESFGDLMTTQRAFVNDRLADIYGVSKQLGPNTFEEVNLTNRPGVMTRAAILAGTSDGSTSPTKRGDIVSESMLCIEVDDPPADIQDRFPTLPARMGRSTRTVVEEVTSSEDVCATCHYNMDTYGFALEHFDHEGRFREFEDGTIAIDDFVGSSLLGEINGFSGLANNVANSDIAQACFAHNWFLYAFNRYTKEDNCAAIDMEQRFVEANGDLRELIRILIDSPAMHYRSL